MQNSEHEEKLVGSQWKTDPVREVVEAGRTGIYVRAKSIKCNAYKSVDISELDKESLHKWLRSRGGENLWAENVVAMLLGHGAF